MFAVASGVALVATLAKAVSAVPCSTTCYYELSGEMSWTSERHPTDFPFMGPNNPEAFFPEFWTVVHDSSFILWRGGQMANPGIQEIAELGSGVAFMEEVETCGDSCGMGEGFICEPMGGTCKVAGLYKVTAEYPYMSTASMLAPSPDWFTGIDSLPLCVDGEWIESYEKEAFPYDAGTDSGVTFLSPDEPTNPFEPITEFGPDDMGIFYNPTEDATLPVGKLYVNRVMCDGDDSADDSMMRDMGGSYGAYGSYGM